MVKRPSLNIVVALTAMAKNKKQINLFSQKELQTLAVENQTVCKMVNADLSIKKINDEAVKDVLTKLQLVSSRQLAKILTKRNDNGLRSARSAGTGFNWYKDKFGNVYYNLPEIMKEIGVGLAE